MANETQANISIVNWDLMNAGRKSEAIIRLQFTPMEIRYVNSSNWAKIPVMGRNNPHYHFTGGEDKLQFQISWYAIEADREDAIKKAQTLRAWSRADGYKNRPPEIKFWLGDLYREDSWVIQSADYHTQLLMTPNYDSASDGAQSDKVCPVHILQDITLLKVTTHNNRTAALKSYK